MYYCLSKCLFILIVLCFPRFSRRSRSQERQTLMQGVPAPDAPMAGPETLPVALQKATTLHSGNLAEPHLFILPPNTAGQAKLKGRPQPQAIHQAPPLLMIAPAPPISLPFTSPSTQLPNVPGPSLFNLPTPLCKELMPPSTPYTTQLYRKKKEAREHAGTFTRKYVRKTGVILCRKCQQERKPPSHLQYFGNWYCEVSETQSYSEWRAVLEQRGYGKKK